MTDTTGGSDASSSDDLIRQAREAYVPGANPPATQPAPARQDDQVAGYAAGETATDTAQQQAMSRPADYVRSDYLHDDGLPADGSSYPAGAGTTYEAQRPSFFSRFGGLLIGGLVVVGFILFSVFDKTTDIEDLSVGDCLLMPDSEEITSVESADCTEPHQLEVFGLVALSAGNNAPYPGDDAVAQGIFDLCLPRFQPYVGTDYNNSQWYINFIYPTRESWVDGDDRSGTCVLYKPDGLSDEPATVTGSARGTAE